MSKLHKINRKSSKSHTDSARRILEKIDGKNRNKRLLGARLRQLEAGFGRPPQRVIDAFKNGTAAETKAFKTDGNRLLFNGNEVARKKAGGIAVSFAGFDTSMTASTIRALGVDTRRVKGVTSINGKTVDPESKRFTFIPQKNISEGAFRISKPSNRTISDNRTVIDDQEIFRRKVRKEFAGNAQKVPRDPTAIQPEDQKQINKLTGVKSKIPRETKGADTHHLLPKASFQGLRTNTFNGVPLSKKNHNSLHKLNDGTIRTSRIGKLQIRLAELKAFTNSSSFVGNMRYDSDEQSLTGILKGKHYQWCDVPERKFDSFNGAGSAGAYFNRNIKGQHNCNSGGILTDLKSRISSLKTAGINPLIRKKKTGNVKSKKNVKKAMIQTAKMLSADSIIDAFIKSGIEAKGLNGVYDPIQNRVLDATIPSDKIRLQELFESGDQQIGFNSVTDTRAGPNADIERVRQQLKQIEADGGVPSLGFDNGSLEANDTTLGNTDTIMSKLLDNQRSTGIVSPDAELEIRDNPRFTGNI